MTTKRYSDRIEKDFPTAGKTEVWTRSYPNGPTVEKFIFHHNSGNITNSTGKNVGNYKK